MSDTVVALYSRQRLSKHSVSSLIVLHSTYFVSCQVDFSILDSAFCFSCRFVCRGGSPFVGSWRRARGRCLLNSGLRSWMPVYHGRGSKGSRGTIQALRLEFYRERCSHARLCRNAARYVRLPSSIRTLINLLWFFNLHGYSSS